MSKQKLIQQFSDMLPELDEDKYEYGYGVVPRGPVEVIFKEDRLWVEYDSGGAIDLWRKPKPKRAAYIDLIRGKDQLRFGDEFRPIGSVVTPWGFLDENCGMEMLPTREYRRKVCDWPTE